VFSVTFITCELFDVELKTLDLSYTLSALSLFFLEFVVFQGFLVLCARAFVTSVIQTFA